MCLKFQIFRWFILILTFDDVLWIALQQQNICLCKWDGELTVGIRFVSWYLRYKYLSSPEQIMNVSVIEWMYKYAVWYVAISNKFKDPVRLLKWREMFL